MPPPVRIRRRALLAGLGAGLAVGVFPDIARADEPGGAQGPGPRPAAPNAQRAPGGLSPNVMVHLALDGTATIVCHRSEMGQGVRSTIPLLIADELGAAPGRVVVQQAVGD
ncbi:MAG: molybdopterin-dependent oxidoreductase, partial [Myxococcales bacterium]|nr:molybdopterin-dependent oxidoreductase [Myxococcales bacterium]